jgi:hypothetical protein
VGGGRGRKEGRGEEEESMRLVRGIFLKMPQALLLNAANELVTSQNPNPNPILSV